MYKVDDIEFSAILTLYVCFFFFKFFFFLLSWTSTLPLKY